MSADPPLVLVCPAARAECHPVFAVAQRRLLGGTGRLTALTRQAAFEYVPHNVLINPVAPGTIDTPILRRHHRGDEAGHRGDGGWSVKGNV